MHHHVSHCCSHNQSILMYEMYGRGVRDTIIMKCSMVHVKAGCIMGMEVCPVPHHASPVAVGIKHQTEGSSMHTDKRQTQVYAISLTDTDAEEATLIHHTSTG